MDTANRYGFALLFSCTQACARFISVKFVFFFGSNHQLIIIIIIFSLKIKRILISFQMNQVSFETTETTKTKYFLRGKELIDNEI